MNIPRAIQKFNIFQYLTLANVQFDVSKDGSEFILECPHCYRQKLSLCADDSDKRGLFHCYRCGASGNLFNLIATLEEIDEKQAFRKVVQGKETESHQKIDFFIKDKPDKKIPHPKTIVLPNHFIPLTALPKDNPGNMYAKSRGLTDEDIKEFKISYSFLDKRIIFPVYFEGNPIGWQGRDVSGRSDKDKKYPKALTGPSSSVGKEGFKKSIVFYGWDRIKDAKFVTIVEGPIDCIKGKIANAIALFGKQMSDTQFRRLITLRNLKVVFIALDSDAKVERIELAQRLRPFFKEVRLVSLPDGKDFGNSTENEVKKFIFNSRIYTHQLMVKF